MRCISENTHEFQIIQKVLLANKIDLPLETHRISSDEGKKLASKHKMEFFEVSAKEGKCINDVFMKLARMVVNAQGSESQVYFQSGFIFCSCNVGKATVDFHKGHGPRNSKVDSHTEDEDDEGGNTIVLKEIPILTKRDKKCCKIK
jgi:hypothetical protein